MISGIYNAAIAMDNATLKHNVVARNLAGMNLPGFRRLLMVEAGATQQRQTYSSEVQTDFTQGAVNYTGEALDAAISGEGFFEVEGPDGPFFTRNGRFRLNAEGTLVTAEGFPVNGEGGPIRIPATASMSGLNIAKDRTVSADGTVLGKIRVVQFADPQKLKAVGSTAWVAPNGVQPENSNAELLHRAFEGSNVSAVSELVEMIAATKTHEAAQRAMRTISDAVERHTNQN